jgi:hypothetical protein
MTCSIRRSALIVAATVACARDTAPSEPRVATKIEVTPAISTVSEGQTQQFVARVLDQKGELLSGVSVTWESNHPELVAIDANGKATAAQSFLETPFLPEISISATADSLSTHVTVSVLRRGTFSAWPDTNVLYVGMTRALTPRIVKTLSGYPGNSLQEPVESAFVSWSSSDATVITVSSTGLVTAVAPGHARVIAKYDNNREATAEVYVSAPPATPLRFTSIASTGVIAGRNSVYQLESARGCAVATDGAVYCWGATLDSTRITDRCEGTSGGAGGYTTWRYRCSEIPLRLGTDITFSAVVTGGSFSCGLATSKRVYCWGSNRNGELGIGTIDSTAHGLAPIAGTGEYTALYGSGPVCGMRTDGVLLCWGGAFGSSPRAIEGGVTWRAIAAAGDCGLAADSTAYCFTTGTAQRVGGTTRWTSIATSKYQTPACALAVDGSVYCGYNLEVKKMPPKPLAGLGTWWGNTASFYTNVCGLTTTGDLMCQDQWVQANLGVTLKRFYFHCGIATDDKLYCFRGSTFALVPGQ